MIRFVLLAAALPAALAQSPAAAAPLPPTIAIHTAPDDPAGGPYGVWAAGHGFKVSFHGGAVFHVDDARGHVQVGLRVVGCRVGAAELHDPARTPRVHWTASRCEYDHGAYVEAYDVLPHGVEQTFVLAQRPAAEGDLVVELALDGPLAPRPLARGEVALTDAGGVPRVHYGAATAIDARGDRRAMRTEVDGGHLRLVCDAGWLARAAWPVTVDPLLQPNPALIVAPKVVDVDLLRDDDETSRNLWVATTVETASGDRDLIVRRFDPGLANGVDVFTDIATGHRTEDVGLAASGGAAKVVVVMTRDFGTSRAVRWHVHGKDDTALRFGVGVLTPPAGSHDWRPAVGGTRAFSFGSRLLLVWQRETATPFANTSQSRVHGAVLDVSGTGNGTLGSPFRLDFRNDVDQESPAVTPEVEGGQAFSWVTAWRARGGIAPFRVHALRVGDDGLVGNRYDAPTGFLLLTQGAPRLAGADGRYLLAFGHGSSSSGGFVELDAVRLDWPHGAAAAVRPHDVFALEAGSPTNVVVDAVAHDNTSRSHWVVTRRDLTADTIRATKLGFRGREVERGELVYPFQENARASAVAFDDDDAEFLVLGATEHTTATQPGRLHLAAMAYDPVAIPSQHGTACGPGRVRFVGSQHAGDELGELDLVQGAPLAATILAFATAPASLPLDVLGAPACTLLVDALGPGALTTIASVTDAGGRMVLPLPLPEELAPMTLHVQAFQFAPSATSLGVTATRALHVELGR